MTDNEKLARWQGYTFVYDSSEGVVFTPPSKPKAAWQHISKLPDYLTDSAACMSLLDTLMEKGYKVSLKSITKKIWRCLIITIGNDKFWFEELKPSINESIIAACLEVVKKEEENGKD